MSIKDPDVRMPARLPATLEGDYLQPDDDPWDIPLSPAWTDETTVHARGLRDHETSYPC